MIYYSYTLFISISGGCGSNLCIWCDDANCCSIFNPMWCNPGCKFKMSSPESATNIMSSSNSPPPAVTSVASGRPPGGISGAASNRPPGVASAGRSGAAGRGSARGGNSQGANSQLAVQPQASGRTRGLSPVTETCEGESDTLLGSSDNGGGHNPRYSIPQLVFEPPDSPTASTTSEKQSPEPVDTDEKSERSDLLLPPSPGYSGRPREGGTHSRWGHLRTTIRMATAMQGKRNRKTSSLMRQDSFLKRFSTRHGGVASTDEESDEDNRMPTWEETKRLEEKRETRFVIHPDENFMFYWLGLVTVAVLYNLWTGIAREAFPEIQDGYEYLWFTLDAVSDMFYVSDIVVQMRTGYLEKGLIVYNSKKLASHYLSSKYFTFDCVCLLPLDLLQFQIGIHPLIRFPRFVKVYRSYRFSYMVETRTIFPNTWRVVNLSHVLFLGSHWFAAFYFMISKAEGFYGAWGYPEPVGEFSSVTRKYLKSLYWSTLTLTTIGDLPPPETNWEWVQFLYFLPLTLYHQDQNINIIPDNFENSQLSWILSQFIGHLSVCRIMTSVKKILKNLLNF